MKKGKEKLPTILRVHAQADGNDSFLGTLSYDAKARTSAFQWSEEALGARVEWSPLCLPLREQMWLSGKAEYDLNGLPGLIHDALPDGWGLLLMDRAFGRAGIRKEEITPLLRLAYLADRCWGALRFEPEWGGGSRLDKQASLMALAEEASLIDQGELREVSNTLLLAGGSPHGARPKILVAINGAHDHVLVGQEILPAGYRHVLVKFAAKDESPTAPILEYCYIRAAKMAGIATMPAEVLDLGDKFAVCVDRFDRSEGQRRHVHSLGGMLHITHRAANADWVNVAQVLKKLSGGELHMLEAFRRATFNALCCIRDDHAKNHAFMRHPDGVWSMSPAYDITYCDGPGGYHTMQYAQHTGKNVTWDDLLRTAQAFNVDQTTVLAELDNCRSARDFLLTEAKGMGVKKDELAVLRRRFLEVDKAISPGRRVRNKAQ